MSMVQANLCERYQNNQVQTANTGELLLLLYDRSVLLTRQAAKLIEAGKPAEAHNLIVKTEDILAELAGTLDFGVGEIAGQLYALYEYMANRLIQANIKKDSGAVAEVSRMLAELRDTWVQIVRGGRKK